MMATLALPSASDPEYSHVFSHFEEEDELRFFLDDDDDDCCRRLDTLLDMPFAFCFGRVGPCNPPSGPPGPPGAMSVLSLSRQNNRTTERSLHSHDQCQSQRSHRSRFRSRGQVQVAAHTAPARRRANVPTHWSHQLPLDLPFSS